MDSAKHQHGASAAPPPPTAAPLPSESNASTPKNPARCNVTPKKSEASAAVSAPPPTASSSSASKTASGISGSGGSAFPHIKKRPLASCTMPTKTTSLRDKIIIVKEVAPPAKAKKTLKKKKRKFSSILSGMMKAKKTKTAAELLLERESLRKNLGGGSFAKVAKI
mmetsp:Transcript_17180/g.39687  ORF Transcript_17180/g.39687 Transcript_17180/m.39687 type:complete len:166 (-) Transcript_17180:299-796(-)|eukprot:CAMPEP_0197181806 /NCGR_PEP_ID=MMETSP1423-20130617/5974_1 /TAXON_ID=476441 /ORGANISM="Pseudo-nitzschia heimii, Strain UNC1101" /LENGTH=165 /DNA_ID=CAMNT_0042632121 /DNA_START=359 /DNA_END=856 /DNA_ORIENTATION=-